MSTFPNDPIARIEWVPAISLQANDYNPNVVYSHELKLLAHSILTTGWVQPVLVDQDLVIIDGFHRRFLAMNVPEIRDKYEGMVPVVKLDISRAERIYLTVRINRAKGSHIAFKMHGVVKELLELGETQDSIERNLGMTHDEVELLAKEGVFEALDIKNHQYSTAWKPKHQQKSEKTATPNPAKSEQKEAPVPSLPQEAKQKLEDLL